MAKLIPEAEARSKIVAVLESSGAAELVERARAARGVAEPGLRPPAWVDRYAAMASDDGLFIWVEPREEPVEAFPSQLVADMPAGRYMVEALDGETGEWVSRESAEGAPLVVGLPGAGHAVLVWIRPAAV